MLVIVLELVETAAVYHCWLLEETKQGTMVYNKIVNVALVPWRQYKLLVLYVVQTRFQLQLKLLRWVPAHVMNVYS